MYVYILILMHACKHLNVQMRRRGQMQPIYFVSTHIYVCTYVQSIHVHTYVCFEHLAMKCMSKQWHINA